MIFFNILINESFISFSDVKTKFQKFLSLRLSLFRFIKFCLIFDSFNDRIVLSLKIFFATLRLILSILSDSLIHNFEYVFFFVFNSFSNLSFSSFSLILRFSFTLFILFITACIISSAASL